MASPDEPTAAATEEIRSPFTEEQMAKAWDDCAQILQSHSDQMIARWKAEIDMLLVFAGLFSAVLTTFNVQSYVMLQPDTGDAALLALAQISAQLSSFSVTPTVVNSTRPAFVLPPDRLFKPLSSAVWINILWFSSLICTLAASSLSIMVKQWLHQYEEGLSGTSRNIARLRQYRYDNLLRWRVEGIIVLIPTLLQTSLGLFLAGLLILLWTLHRAVAIVALILVALLLTFKIYSTIIPIFRSDCPYQTPQALSVYIASQFFFRFLAQIGLTAIEGVANLLARFVLRHNFNWAYRLHIVCLSKQVSLNLWLRPRSKIRRWRAREQAETSSKWEDIDASLAVRAYELTLDDTVLSASVAPCLSQLDPVRVIHCARNIVRTRAALLAPVRVFRKGATSRSLLPYVLTVNLKATQVSDEAFGDLSLPLALELYPSWARQTPDVPADTELGQQFLYTMGCMVLRGWNREAACVYMLSYLADGLNKGARIPDRVVFRKVAEALPKEAIEWARMRPLGKRFPVTKVFRASSTLMAQFSMTHASPVEPASEKGPHEPVYDALTDVFRFIIVYLTHSSWREHEAARQSVSTTLHETQILPLSESELLCAPSALVTGHLDLTRTLEDTIRFLGETIPSYQQPPWAHRLRDIRRICESLVAVPQQSAVAQPTKPLIPPLNSKCRKYRTPQDRFTVVMQPFVLQMSSAVDSLKNMGTSLDSELRSLLSFSGEDPSSPEAPKPEDFFGLILSFSSSLQKAALEVHDAMPKIAAPSSQIIAIEEEPESASEEGTVKAKEGDATRPPTSYGHALGLSVGRGDLDQAIRSMRTGRRRDRNPASRPLSKIFVDGTRASRVIE